jgi:hypothetical protein
VFPGRVGATGEGLTDGFLRRQILLRVVQAACGMKPLEPMRRL